MQKNLLLIALAPIVMLALIIGANWGQFQMINDGIAVSAQRTALQWTEHLADMASTPDDSLGNTDESINAMAMHDVQVMDDVLYFAIYDATGAREHAVSDSSLPIPLTDTPDRVFEVLETGEPQVDLIDVFDGGLIPGLQARAFVAMRDANGSVSGVAEILIDQTEVAYAFRFSAVRLSIILTLLFTVTLAVLYAGYQVKRRQEMNNRRKADFLANFDQLTGILNRAGFSSALTEFERRGGLANTAVLFMDVDNFKTINDAYGHQAGDAFLRHFGEAIARNLRQGDIAARFGGDEFVVVARRSNMRQVKALVDGIRRAVAAPMAFNTTTVCGTASAGVFYDHSSLNSASERMQKADIALYQAKADGRDTCRLFTADLESRFRHRHALELAIRNGLSNKTFHLEFQPLMDRKSGKAAGFEALLRLEDAEGNPVPPSEFIPVAETMGLIEEIGRRTLFEAARTAAQWPEHLFVAVNLSSRQFDSGNLVPTVREVLASTGLAPRRLELEVTESVLMENSENVAMQMRELQALGVSLAMDDFGTGYSSLGYLWQFGFDKLKIDGSFVAGIGKGDDKAKQLLDTIVMLGHRLGMSVTAEGIETETQADLLSRLSCDVFQGYLFGKPMPPGDLAAFLLNESRASREPEGEAAAAENTRTPPARAAR